MVTFTGLFTSPFLNLVALGAVAGFTIFLGLPVAKLGGLSQKARGMLNAAAAGILLFLLVDIMGNALGVVSDNVLSALAGKASAQTAVLHLALLLFGMALSLLGMVWFEGRFIPAGEKTAETGRGMTEGKARRIAMMIAAGIGLHNFSEGLAIGQSYAGGAVSFALLLVIGFGLHNATEGFGISAPLSGFRPRWRFLGMLGFIGGAPTFIGAVVGGFFVSQAISVFFLALAAGAIIYVVKELLYHGRIAGEGIGTMGFLLAGFFAGFGTDLLIKFASGG